MLSDAARSAWPAPSRPRSWSSSCSRATLREPRTLAFARLPATSRPQPDQATPQLLRESVGGVRFPDYAKTFGWRAAGTRIDELDGRSTRTVFYVRENQRIAYTIVDGAALDEREDVSPVQREGVALRVLAAESGTGAVTWRRAGRTCVLSGAVSTEVLLELASWKGKGAVRF